MTSFIFLGGPAFVFGLVLSFALARTAARSFTLTGVGMLAVGALLTIAFLAAPSDGASSCHDCSEYAGRWLDPVVFLGAAFNAAAWFAGVLLGAGFRRGDRGERGTRPYEVASWILVGVAVLVFWRLAQSA